MKKFLIPLLAISLLQLTLIAAAEDRQPGSGVLACVQPEQGADGTLREVVRSMLEVQFERRGTRLTSVQVDAAVPSAQAQSGLKEAAKQNTQYFVLAKYTTSSTDFGLDVELYDVASSKSLSTGAASGRIGLALDSVVAEAVDRALVGVMFRPAPQPPSAQTSSAGGTAATPVPGVTTNDGGNAPSTTGGTSRADKKTTGARGGARLGFTGGAAPFVPLGGPGNYAQLGVLATLSGNYRFPVGPGQLGVGFLTGVGAMNVAGLVADGNLVVVPIGAEVTYSMNEGGFPGVLARLSAGPAVMGLTTAYDGTLTKTVPYVLAGLDLSLPFTSFLGLSIELAWASFFESTSLAIMGFVPEVTLYVRF
jgi:hypothetical protein